MTISFKGLAIKYTSFQKTGLYILSVVLYYQAGKMYALSPIRVHH